MRWEKNSFVQHSCMHKSERKLKILLFYIKTYLQNIKQFKKNNEMEELYKVENLNEYILQVINQNTLRHIMNEATPNKLNPKI